MKVALVSVVIPTYNCDKIIVDCLESVKKQTYKPIELIVVDSFSTDNTAKIAKKYGTVYSFGKKPEQKNVFAAPFQRNYGVSKAKGEYVYFIDSDMRLFPDTITACVQQIVREKADAVIVKEVSYGESFWAQCRALEKSCYNASPRSYTDAARFVKRSVWNNLKGLDTMVGGGDDYDFQHRLDQNGYKTVKSIGHILHYEGKLSLKKQIVKKFIYGKTAMAYFSKHKSEKTYVAKQYLRPEFVQHADLLMKQPLHAIGMFFMKGVEYTAAVIGLIYSQIKKDKFIAQGS
jgi:glycosyltransferase involved in cell wall biosynthesis